MLKRPLILDQNSQGKTLVPIEENQGAYNEIWLQKTLENNPLVLPVHEVEDIFAPLVTLGREIHTDTGGFIDNLFISPKGYVTFAETKLWRNPQAKREVLTQVIDYATSISKLEYKDLDAIFQTYLQQKNEKAVSLSDWMHAHYQVDIIDFEKKVTKFLKQGRFLILVVGDRIRGELIYYLDDAIKTTSMQINIALVELRCFTLSKDQDWPLFVVPFIPKQTEVVQHHVTIGSQISEPYYQPSQRVQSKITGKRSVTQKLSEKQYWELLNENGEPTFSIAKSLIEEFRKMSLINIEFSESAIVVKYNPLKMTLFYIHDDGRLATNPPQIKKTLNSKGLVQAFTDHEEFIRDTLGMHGKKIYKEPITQVDVAQFKQGVTALMERIGSHRRR